MTAPRAGGPGRIGVVVVTYLPGANLPTFLDSVLAASRFATPVVVADNGQADGRPLDPDGESVLAAAARPHVTVLATGGNLGYGRAANLGARRLYDDHPDLDLVAVCNPDLTLLPGALDTLVEAADRWPRGGSFGPQLRTPDGRVYPSARDLPSIGRGIGHALCGPWWPSNPWTRAYRRQDDALTERVAGWLSGACLVIRRAAFEEVGGFDPGYFMYFEDVDLGARLAAAGWQNVLVPAAVAVHTGGQATGRRAEAMQVAHHDSAYRYLSRQYAAWYQAPLRLALRAGLLARSVLARRNERFGAGAAIPPGRVGSTN